MPESAVFAGADDVLDPGVDPVGGVDVGGLPEPAPGVRAPVGDPQAVPPAVLGLEQGQLRAGVRPLAAGEHPPRARPSPPLAPPPPLPPPPAHPPPLHLLPPPTPYS